MNQYSLDAFLEACGATGPLQLTVEHPGGADRHVLQQPFAVVGRDPRADVRLADAAVGRRHLYLQVLGGRLLCLDLTGSPDGRRQPRHMWLDAGHEVRVGTAPVRLTDAPSRGGELVSLRDATPHVTLDITGGPEDKAGLRVRHPLVLIGC